MRLRPDLLGPMVVATPHTDRTPLLTDGNLSTGWASQDTAGDHWAEITFPEPTEIGRVALHWPEWRDHYRTGLSGGEWSPLVQVDDNPERAWSVHVFERRPLEGLRIVQPRDGGFPEHSNRLWLTQIELF